ncbi:hypothetical protein [Microbulbifer sp. ALW1]|uniref:hypothetical protein n=1 Tax=Microbulbifer sp. (strain ALW1) TaxID=1516059 RepID=UPI00135B9C34|nr:hypothetical protein [Microbulbifer sp. ALW1]
MEIFLYVLIVLLLLCVALSPSLVIWLCAYLWLPDAYKLPPYRMTVACFILALVTAFLMNVELEGGAGSGVVVILALSVIWSAILVPIGALAKYLKTRYA